MQRLGHLIITLRPGEAFRHVPCHLDCQCGACRPAGYLDGGEIDRALKRWGTGFRAAGVYHARRSLGRAGEQHLGFDEVEEQLGLSRTYQIEIGERAATSSVIQELRDLALIERAGVQMLATAPFAKAPVLSQTNSCLTKEHAWQPHRMVGAPQAHNLEPGDERVRVAVVDTGVSLGHPELQRMLLAGFDTVDLGIGRVNEQIRLVGDSWGRDFAPRDETGHGSHVAGIIGAHGWRVPPGVAGRSLILPIRVLAAARAVDASEGKLLGIGALSNIDCGMKVAVDLGADVLNMSFGTPAASVDWYGPTPHAQIVAYAMHYGCVLVAAAGNSGIEERYYPAALPEVIAVGSLDEHGRRSRFSTYGDHLALCAPGERIISLGVRGYKVSTGTSHAAPFVAGAAALLVSRGRRAGRKIGSLEVKRILTKSARPLSATGFSPETGYGLLDIPAALRHLEKSLKGVTTNVMNK